MSAAPSESPDRTLPIALGVSVLVAAVLVVAHAASFAASLGDTDDALRLVMVRELLAGRGWFDQHMLRLQPPVGLYMHWSRLVDGGEAGLERLFGLVLPAASAEAAMRLSWPLLWILPAVAAALSLARSLRRDSQLVCALLLATSLNLYVQFLPGRVDHHNIQIALCLTAVAAAARGATLLDGVVAGAATALGLAVGLEALPFLAVAGAGVTLRLLLQPTSARAAKGYGLALGLTSVAAFMIQVPPTRWGVPACDAMAVNLVAGLGLGGLGVAAAAMLAPQGRPRLRLVLIMLAALAAAAGYLGLHPACIRGPMAEIDPRLKPIWFQHIQELQSWPTELKADPVWAVTIAAAPLLGLLGAAWLLAQESCRRRPEVLIATACLATAVLAAVFAIRSAHYAAWLAIPVLAAAVADLGARLWTARPLRTFALAGFGSPLLVGAAAGGLLALALPADARNRSPHRSDTPQAACFRTRPYAPLASLSAGRALAPIDLGPYILASSRLSVMSAPYHRMSFGVLAASDVLASSPAAAEAKARALGVGYVVDCPALRVNDDHVRMGPGSLQAALDGGRAPAWLQPLSPAGSVITVYRLRPPA